MERNEIQYSKLRNHDSLRKFTQNHNVCRLQYRPLLWQGSVCIVLQLWCDVKQASHGFWGSVSWICTPTLFRRVILVHKIGQIDPVFRARWACISRSMCTQNYKCPCARVTICDIKVFRKLNVYILTPLTPENRSNHRWICQLVHPRQMHLWRKFGDRRSVTCEYNAHTFFYDDL